MLKREAPAAAAGNFLPGPGRPARFKFGGYVFVDFSERSRPRLPYMYNILQCGSRLPFEVRMPRAVAPEAVRSKSSVALRVGEESTLH